MNCWDTIWCKLAVRCFCRLEGSFALITAAPRNADEDRILFIAFTCATGAKTSVTMRPLLVALPKSDLPSTQKQLR